MTLHRIPNGWDAERMRVDPRQKPRTATLGKYHGAFLDRLVVDCPFCGTMIHTANDLAWCTGCYVEWTKRGQVVTFDPSKRTERFAWGKAFAKAGGARIGSDVRCRSCDDKPDDSK